MADIFEDDAGIHFGDIDGSLPDWRDDRALETEADPDDEELDETPEDVIAVLGFDPKDL